MEMKKFTRLSLLLALCIVLNIIESVIPLFNGYIPGLKLGLANIVILFILYCYSFKDALYVSLLRVVIVGITRTGLFSVAFFFSLGGAFLSIIMMSLFKKLTNLSVIGVSIIGSISHSIGQIIMAIILIKSNLMVMYLPWLLMFSIPTGIITGKIALKMLENFKELNEVGVSLY
ncbi:MAG: Gx transporter family protein [Bacilli bacterium]|jgi:heptaprenyl diphosphate synthase|nr:Gx transporter family protein [Bacilli bacterium]